MFTHDVLRDRLLKKAGVTKTQLADLYKSEWSSLFEQLMRNRLVMGSFRYQPFSEKCKSFNYDCATEAKKRVDMFIETGNTEHLVDAANMCLIEFEFSCHPNKHFESVDDGEHAEEIKK